MASDRSPEEMFGPLAPNEWSDPSGHNETRARHGLGPMSEQEMAEMLDRLVEDGKVETDGNGMYRLTDEGHTHADALWSRVVDNDVLADLWLKGKPAADRERPTAVIDGEHRLAVVR